MTLLEMSVMGAVMILVIAVMRKITLNKLPKKTFVLLWEIAILRLILPFSVQSVTSVYTLFARKSNMAEVTLPAVWQAQNVVIPQNVLQPNNNATSEIPAPFPDYNVWQIIWLVGMVLMVSGFVVLYAVAFKKYHSKTELDSGFAAEWLKDHQIKRTVKLYLSDRVSSPLTYGIIRPVILIPVSCDIEDKENLTYILTHEMTHIKRFDMARKFVAAAVLCLHWFNPFVWVMYLLFNRDMELVCDEAVVRSAKTTDCRKSYISALINLEEQRGFSLYNNFSKNAVEERIVAIMKSKKMGTISVIAACALTLSVICGFATSAERPKPEEKTAGSSSDLLNENDLEKFFALQFDDYRHMKISDFQNKVWKMTDTAEYRELFERYSNDETLYSMKDSDETANFLYYVLFPLTSENWQSHTYSGAVVSDFQDVESNAIFEYEYTLTISNADDAAKIMVKDYYDIGSELRNSVFADIFLGQEKEDLQNESIMKARYDDFLNRVTADMQSPEVEFSLEYSYRPLIIGNGNENTESDKQGEELEERMYPRGTQDDYNSLLALKTADYENMSVSEFNANLLKWANSDYDRTNRIQEDIYFEDFSADLSEDERDFITFTYSLSNTENYYEIDIKSDPCIRGFNFNKDADGNSAAWARLNFLFSYHISDKDNLTVGERNRCIRGFVSEMQRFWDNTSVDELLKMSENDIVAYMEEVAEKNTNKFIKIYVDADNVLFEAMDERGYFTINS